MPTIAKIDGWPSKQTNGKSFTDTKVKTNKRRTEKQKIVAKQKKSTQNLTKMSASRLSGSD